MRVSSQDTTPERSSSSIPQQTCDAHRISQLRLSLSWEVELQGQYRSNISSKFSLMIKTLAKSRPPNVGFCEAATAQRPNRTFTAGASESNTSTTYEEYVEDCKVGAEDWPVQNFELTKDSTMANHQIHQTGVFLPINENDEDDTDCGALTGRADQRDQLSQTGSSITIQPWTCGQDPSCQGHWRYYGLGNS